MDVNSLLMLMKGGRGYQILLLHGKWCKVNGYELDLCVMNKGRIKWPILQSVEMNCVYVIERNWNIDYLHYGISSSPRNAGYKLVVWRLVFTSLTGLQVSSLLLLVFTTVIKCLILG